MLLLTQADSEKCSTPPAILPPTQRGITSSIRRNRLPLPSDVSSAADIGNCELKHCRVADLHLIEPNDPVHIIRPTHASSGQTEPPPITEMPVVVASIHEWPDVLYTWGQLNRHDLIRACLISEEHS